MTGRGLIHRRQGHTNKHENSSYALQLAHRAHSVYIGEVTTPLVARAVQVFLKGALNYGLVSLLCPPRRLFIVETLNRFRLLTYRLAFADVRKSKLDRPFGPPI